MTKQYMQITNESLTKIMGCFTDDENLRSFIRHLENLNSELSFNFSLMKRVDDENITSVALKQVCLLTIFCREYIDLIHDLISHLQYTKLTQDELNKLQDTDGLLN